MKICVKCGIEIPHGNLCQTCRKYQNNGGIWHELPQYGEVKYDEYGKPICHICGMAYDKLIEHTIRKHKLNSEEYRSKFGLMKETRLTSPKYSNKMKEYTEQNKTHLENFKSTWAGEKRYIDGRKPNSWSEQEKISRHSAQVANSKKRKKDIND